MFLLIIAHMIEFQRVLFDFFCKCFDPHADLLDLLNDGVSVVVDNFLDQLDEILHELHHELWKVLDEVDHGGEQFLDVVRMCDLLEQRHSILHVVCDLVNHVVQLLQQLLEVVDVELL